MSGGERTGAKNAPDAHLTEIQRVVQHLDADPVREFCREWPENRNRCNAPAEFILWGKLFPPEALGPRCYACAEKHVGSRALTDPAWAIFHLAGLYRAADASPAALPSAGKDGEQ